MAIINVNLLSASQDKIKFSPYGDHDMLLTVLNTDSNCTNTVANFTNSEIKGTSVSDGIMVIHFSADDFFSINGFFTNHDEIIADIEVVSNGLKFVEPISMNIHYPYNEDYIIM